MTGSVSLPDPPAGKAEKDAGSMGPARRILPTGRVGVLIAGDVLSFLLFAALGLHQHEQGTAAGMLAYVGLVIATAIPFAAGWFLVSPFLHAFKRSHTVGVGPMLRQTEVAWLCSWPVALVLRWVFSSDHRVPPSFAVVILIANAIFLGVWRTVFALVEMRRGVVSPAG
jgi:hypothetical protein